MLLHTLNHPVVEFCDIMHFVSSKIHLISYDLGVVNCAFYYCAPKGVGLVSNGSDAGEKIFLQKLTLQLQPLYRAILTE